MMKYRQRTGYPVDTISMTTLRHEKIAIKVWADEQGPGTVGVHVVNKLKEHDDRFRQLVEEHKEAYDQKHPKRPEIRSKEQFTQDLVRQDETVRRG